jgi:two-component system, OmpR family, alkaline phosphatase synthesis response regulator PhoP
VLVVEDHQDIADLIRLVFERSGHAVDALTSGTEVMAAVRARRPDLIILDLMLPGMDGLLVCQALRQNPATAPLPIIMLTARGEESDRLRGFEMGADDYVTKPFSPKELVARATALLRRIERPAAPPTQLRYGSVVVDVDRHLVEADGRDVRLTAKEFLLLRYLIEHRGRVLSRDVLLTDVWGYQYTGGTRTVDVHVRRLREKLPLLHRAITTVKQFGYRLEDPPPAS